MIERSAPKRHPSTAIPDETLREITYRLYLRRLEPPMTPEQSASKVTVNANGDVTSTDATRRKAAEGYLSMTRDYLRVLWDMGMILTDEDVVG